MPSIQVTGVLEDPTTGVESNGELRIISKINYGKTTKNSDSTVVLTSAGAYNFQLAYGKHLIAVKSKDSQVFTNIGTVVVGDGSPSPIDIITLIATSNEEPDPILITQLQLIAAEAAASADAAAQSEANAAQSESNANDSALSASTSETNAANSASSAQTSAVDSAQSEANAANSATSAAQSETNSANSALSANDSAADAQLSATNAAQSEANASNSANAAALSETNAAQSAASASDDADRAEAAALTASSGVIDRGSWDASTGNFPTPTLTPEERTDWYRISVAGVMSDGVQPDIDASVGDNLYWDKQNDVWYKIDNTDKVNSVNGKEGDVVLDASDFDDIYSKTEVDNALLSKANSSDVYLKTDTYSQTEIDDALSWKANSSDVYQKTETYSQTEVDSMLSDSAKASFIKFNLFRGMPMSAVGPTPDPDIFLPAGRVELLRADYPTVFGIVSASAFYTSQATIDADPRQYAGYWGDGDGVNTFTTDDWALMMNIKVAGGYGAAGSTKEDHIQNITGDFQIATSGSSSQIIRTANGAFSKNNPGGLGAYPNIASTESGVAYNMNFNAALSARTSDITDTMGLFLDHYRVIPKGVFSYA
ncbi:prophage tail fiber N-terminal domain-containing protein [Vibrio fluvialis]